MSPLAMNGAQSSTVVVHVGSSYEARRARCPGQSPRDGAARRTRRRISDGSVRLRGERKPEAAPTKSTAALGVAAGHIVCSGTPSRRTRRRVRRPTSMRSPRARQPRRGSASMRSEVAPSSERARSVSSSPRSAGGCVASRAAAAPAAGPVKPTPWPHRRSIS